jgi:DNA ligase 1
VNKATLYGKDKSGKFKQWSIWTVDDSLFIEHGQEGGKLQLKEEKVKGKNIGRSNETSDSEQAELEANSRINKQTDKGYRADKSELEELPLLPMLANDYLKQGHRIKYPCYASAKLDGVRCLAICTEDGIILKSRGGKLYDVKHIVDRLQGIMKVGQVWDGELYIHGKYLEEIVSAVKKPNENTKDIHFIIFDFVTEDTFVNRMKEAQKFKVEANGCLEVLDYQTLFSEEDMKSLHKRYVSLGYEGIMLRNTSGLYESGKRSADLQKYKEFLDEEFEIVAVGEDKQGNAVLQVFDPTAGETFTVCYGDFEERKNQLENWRTYIGKKLTVKYQTRYKDSKLPQFPTGVIIRDYE